MKTVTKCRHCGTAFSPNGRGRPQLYCRPSHRVRAREKRQELERRVPGEKEFRLLRQRLESLQRYRVHVNRIPGLEDMRQFGNLPRNKAYQRAVERVREVLIRLAPEVVQDLNQPWLAYLSAIEATGIIQRQEEYRRPPTPRQFRNDVGLDVDIDVILGLIYGARAQLPSLRTFGRGQPSVGVLG